MLDNVPVPALVALGILVCCQLALQIFALIDLKGRQRVLHDRKWLWVVIIIGGQIIGPIVYLAFGRKVDDVVDHAAATGDVSARSKRALDVLYDPEDPE